MVLMLALGTVFSFMTYGVWTDNSNWTLKITTPILATLLVFGLIATPKLFSKRYYSISVDTDTKTLVIRYPLRRQETKILFKDIRGYSKSTDNNYSRVWVPKKDCITLYLLNGDKVDLVQYQFSGFKKFRDLIENLNFQFLGDELFIIDFKGRRKMYKY
jgi:hypothetical protein